MLKNLSIVNFKLIKALEVEFEPGMTVITGETGAGKSLLVNALATIFWQKPRREMLASPTGSTRISATFSLAGGFVAAEDEIIVSRLLGWKNDRLRNRAYLNEQPASGAFLAELGGRLLEIASQHQQQALLKPRHHLFFLDLFGNLGE
ncbi:MAG: AAA family ATPase, partial [Deltaproteobacteria bacterium]|nr:AAA family ATPase [Deltaproteobacteria bacterium]